MEAPPKTNPDLAKNFITTDQYYESITSPDQQYGLTPVVDHLDICHGHRLRELESMPRRTLDTVWWPFVQHKLLPEENDVTVIDSAYGDFFSVSKRDIIASHSKDQSILGPEFDGSASWWTQTLGHAHPSLTLAAARASGRYGHVIFPQATHLPALKLAERLVHEGPGKGWASRAFFSDNGSTGMEVAIKMALRAFVIRQGESLKEEEKKNLGILGLKGSYHGDTIGAMDACEEGVYSCEWHDAKGFWFDPPSVSFRNGEVVISIPPAISAMTKPTDIRAESLSWAYDIEERLRTPLARAYAVFIERTLDNLEQRGGVKLAALVIEPLVMGAGGMVFVDPLFQRVMVDMVRGRSSGVSSEWSGLPVIFDEVFVGLQRIGMESTGPLLGVYPDISVNAKILTGGLIPLAVTMASKSIFEAFLGDSKADALLHGHSYTAHPIGCEVANETLNIIDKITATEEWKGAQAKWALGDGRAGSVWSLWNPQFVRSLSKLPQVGEVMTLGTVLSIKVKAGATGRLYGILLALKASANSDTGYTSLSAQEKFQGLRKALPEEKFSSAPGGTPFGVHFRTLGDVAYFMTSLNTSSAVIRSVEDKIWQSITE